MTSTTDMGKMDTMILQMEIENLKSFIDLKAQYVKELGDAAENTGLCAGMPFNQRLSIINDLNDHITGIDEAIKISRDRIAEIRDRLDPQTDI